MSVVPKWRFKEENSPPYQTVADVWMTCHGERSSEEPCYYFGMLKQDYERLLDNPEQVPLLVVRREHFW